MELVGGVRRPPIGRPTLGSHRLNSNALDCFLTALDRYQGGFTIFACPRCRGGPSNPCNDPPQPPDTTDSKPIYEIAPWCVS
jgi:hypothetical protein